MKFYKNTFKKVDELDEGELAPAELLLSPVVLLSAANTSKGQALLLLLCFVFTCPPTPPQFSLPALSTFSFFLLSFLCLTCSRFSHCLGI